MAKLLNVAQQTISNRLKAMRKIQKCRKWMPRELNDRQMENQKTHVKRGHYDTIESQYCIKL